ncbi:MAG TPA: nickel-dependent lactate racemase [Anaerolineae bacterium]
MHLKLAYGKTGLDLELPDRYDVTVVEPRFVPAVADPQAALAAALAAPIGSARLREFAAQGAHAGIVFSDITRATPNHLLLPAVLAELDLPPERITLFNALGTHRPNTEAELRGMLGDAIVDRYRIVQNNAFDPDTQVCLGRSTRGHEIWLNREFASCEIKVLTGFIEPHFFAGYSGGGKAVMPGMAGQKTVLGNHDAGMIADPAATWGVTRGNPIWEEIQEVSHQAGRLFLLNVTLNKNKEITGVFAGDLDLAHAAGCAYVKETAMVSVPHAFDIVITSNSGYPLDLNLYQTVKGMSAAAQVVRPGGAIIAAAECWDGIPAHGLYGKLLASAPSPAALLETIAAPGFLEQDQWQAQIQAQIQGRADVYVYSDHLSADVIQSALLLPTGKIEDTVAALVDRYGPQATICVLPEGPQTIPYVAR